MGEFLLSIGRFFVLYRRLAGFHERFLVDYRRVARFYERITLKQLISHQKTTSQALREVVH